MSGCNCTGACRRYGSCYGVPAQNSLLEYGRAEAPPRGCICPPTSEQTCQASLCPRKPILGAIGGAR